MSPTIRDPAGVSEQIEAVKGWIIEKIHALSDRVEKLDDVTRRRIDKALDWAGKLDDRVTALEKRSHSAVDDGARQRLDSHNSRLVTLENCVGRLETEEVCRMVPKEPKTDLETAIEVLEGEMERVSAGSALAFDLWRIWKYFEEKKQL